MKSWCLTQEYLNGLNFKKKFKRVRAAFRRYLYWFALYLILMLLEHFEWILEHLISKTKLVSLLKNVKWFYWILQGLDILKLYCAPNKRLFVWDYWTRSSITYSIILLQLYYPLIFPNWFSRHLATCHVEMESDHQIM